MLGYLVEDLTTKGKVQEAVGLMTRNKCDTHVREDVLSKLKDVVYDESKDTSLQKFDAFETLSKPENEFIQLPESVKVHWIGTDADCEKLESLLSEEFIGVDSEWRPQLT